MKKTGFVLLFAVLISSILLSVGLALTNISFKEIILSAASRDSQLAFFASDTGSECAFFWDRKWLENNLPVSPFPENSNFNAPTGPAAGPGGSPPPSPWDAVKCHGKTITTADPLDTDWKVVANATAATTTFKIHLGPNDRDGCVTVTVAKNLPAGHVLPDTKFISVGASSCSTNDPRAVERTIENTIPGF